MTTANYLRYPSLQKLIQAGAGRPQMERAAVSYTYVQLCRQTLHEACSESMLDPALRFSLGDDLGANSLAVTFMHLVRNNFTEDTGLRGPILAFAMDEFNALISWIQRNGINLPLPATTDGLTIVTQRWIGNISKQCPRSLWFSYAINQPAFIALKGDLKAWRHIA